MEEKKYKRVPFTIEIAKKIQSGEVEGRIVTDQNNVARILCYDFDCKGYPIGAAINVGTGERFCCVTNTGLRSTGEQPDDGWFTKLFIELPEEAPIDNDGNHGFCRFIPNPNHREGVMGDYSLAPLNENKSINILKSSVSTKYEFKPFDKVLVKYDKEGAKWFPTILSQVINGLYVNVADKVFKECIHYEGNEHLVGTTNKPE
jgi:hypothetical protein